MNRFLLALAVLLFAAGAGLAQSVVDTTHWPERPIHFIVPFPPGSSSDIVARLVAQKLGELGHEHVREHFLITTNVKRYLTLFLHCAGIS